MSLAALYMYSLTIRIRSDDTIRPNTNTLFGPLFGTEANTKRMLGTSYTALLLLSLLLYLVCACYVQC